MLDPVTKEVKYSQVDKNIEPADWVKGQTFTYVTNMCLPEELPTGDYLLCGGIVDTTKGNFPEIELSLPTERLIKDWVYISQINIE